MSRSWLSRVNLKSPTAGVALLTFGTGLSALGNLVLVGVVARNFSVHDSAYFLTWWATVTSAAIGLGLIEVTITRKLISDDVHKTKPLHADFVGEGLTVTLLLVFLMVIASAGLLIKGTVTLIPYLLSLSIFPFLLLVQVFQRGEALSQKKFADSACQIAIEGLGRLIIVALLIYFTNIGIDGLIIASSLSSILAILFMRFRRVLHFAIPKSFRNFAISPELLKLSTSTLGVIFVSYLVAPWFASRINSAQIVTIFIASLTLSRIPMQFMGAFFSPVMVHISGLYESGNFTKVKIMELLIIKRTLVLILIFIPIYVVLAPSLLTIYLGKYNYLSSWVIFGQALVSGLLFICAVVQAILVAQNKWKTISNAWLPAIALMTLIYLMPGDALWIAVLGPLIVTIYVLLRMLYPSWNKTSI